MDFSCFKCGARYETQQQLMRHVRQTHPSKVIKCNECSYMVSTSLRYKMVEHQRRRHGIKVDSDNKTKKTTELIIPDSPYVPKRKEKSEKPRKTDSHKKEIKSKVIKVMSPKKETVSKAQTTPPKKNIKRKAVSVSSETLTPITSTPDDSFSIIFSPASIKFGFEDHGPVSPVRKDLQHLFGPPVKALSPLPETPKKKKLDTPSESFIVIEDEVISNAGDAYKMVSREEFNRKVVEKCPTQEKKSEIKKDSSHLALPNKKNTEEGKKWQRFLAPPSMFQKSSEAAAVRDIRKAAVESPNYIGSVLPYGTGCVKKDEKVVFPDGTIYSLSACWVADPKLCTFKERGEQTDICKTKEAGINTDENIYIATSVLDKSINTSPTKTCNAVTLTPRILIVDRGTQTESVSEEVIDMTSDDDGEETIQVKIEYFDCSYIS